MKKIIPIFIFLVVFLLNINPVDARSGCCSHHGGVCGCRCCDGTSLSSTCAPYYPSCGSSNTTTTATPVTPVTTYELDGQVYYSKSAYEAAVEEKFETEHKAGIADLFEKVLTREPTEEEVQEWFDYSRDLDEIKEALFASDERKELMEKKEAEKQEREVSHVQQTVVSDVREENNDNDSGLGWFWWYSGITGLTGIIAHRRRKRKDKKS